MAWGFLLVISCLILKFISSCIMFQFPLPPFVCFPWPFPVHTCVLLVIHPQCFPLTIGWFICFALVYLQLPPDSSCYLWFVLSLLSHFFSLLLLLFWALDLKKKKKKKQELKAGLSAFIKARLLLSICLPSSLHLGPLCVIHSIWHQFKTLFFSCAENHCQADIVLQRQRIASSRET